MIDIVGCLEQLLFLRRELLESFKSKSLSELTLFSVALVSAEVGGSLFIASPKSVGHSIRDAPGVLWVFRLYF
jgi:hypothetical protein